MRQAPNVNVSRCVEAFTVVEYIGVWTADPEHSPYAESTGYYTMPDLDTMLHVLSPLFDI